MRYRPLGSSSIQVSVVGFGAWGIGGRTPGATSYGATDDAVSRRALHEAFDRGITFYDTASVYGDGHSEELIGECFDGRRHEIVIATKAGITSSFRGYDFSAPALRASLEGSLRRLRTDYVDLFQLHNAGPDVVLHQPHIVELLQRFVAEGKVGGRERFGRIARAAPPARTGGTTSRYLILRLSVFCMSGERGSPRIERLPSARGPNSMRPWNQPTALPSASVVARSRRASRRRRARAKRAPAAVEALAMSSSSKAGPR